MFLPRYYWLGTRILAEAELANKDKKRAMTGAEDAGKPNSEGFRPSDFMRARRPSLFSDSRVSTISTLSASVLEYHLSTLTSRNQERDFEHFCRRLAEKTLCPNLVPQTGPVGGGDSKVDSENYPVSDEIAMRWYEGAAVSGRKEERWAFAFSAKQAWRAKAESDVRKIANTKRGYKLIYFVTNQFVKDKVRAELESALTKRYRVPLRILDRQWIVKRIIDDKLEELAIDALHLTGYQADKKTSGPRDVRRQKELEQLEKKIQDTDHYRGVEYQLGEDCLRAALLARGLEFARTDIEGRFERAERIAVKLGYRQQRLRVAYAKAWTTFWWFDDFEELINLYEQVEELAVDSDNANDLELLTNVWTLLTSCVKTHGIDASVAKLDARTAILRAELERLASDKERLNNALWAKTNLILMRLQEAATDAQTASALLRELKPIVAQSEVLISYPVEAVSRIITELGDFLGGNPEYDDLFEELTETMRRRTSDGEAGRMLLARAHQKLRAKKIYDAIRLYGRAQLMLAKREYRLELIAALVGGGMAYEAAGLLWAARANILAGANQAFAELTEHGEILPQALVCLRKLVWLELQLGRIPAVLQWIETASIIAQNLNITGKRRDDYLEERGTQDAILGILFLKTGIIGLRLLSSLPPALDRLGLERSRMALLYSLGYEDFLRKEGTIPETETQQGVQDFFLKWIKQPASKDLPAEPELGAEAEVLLRSLVLGCQVEARVANTFDSLCLGERILASLESLLATSLEKGVFPHCEEFNMRIEPSKKVDRLGYRLEPSSSGDILVVSQPVEPPSASKRSVDARWLQDLVVEIALRIALPRDPKEFAGRVFGQEQAFGRAITFSDPSVPLGNIVGSSPRMRVSDWRGQEGDQQYPPLRKDVWSHGLELPASDKDSRIFDDAGKFGEGEPPPGLLDFSAVKHTETRVFSLIDMPTWDKARWIGIGYAIGPDLSEPPILGLAFRDAEAAKKIFSNWRAKLGEVDEEEQLHVALVLGVDKKHPPSYAAVIGSNPSTSNTSGIHHFVSVSRIHRMDPPDSKNLDAFLARFDRVGGYWLVPAQFDGESKQPKFFFDLSIAKRTLRVLPAWKLGQNDPDSLALRPEDDPIIPEGVEDAPVLGLLERRKRNPREI
jgi:hypothetical protein